MVWDQGPHKQILSTSFLKLFPFLKLYTPWVKGYLNALTVFKDLMERKRKFRKYVKVRQEVTAGTKNSYGVVDSPLREPFDRSSTKVAPLQDSPRGFCNPLTPGVDQEHAQGAPRLRGTSRGYRQDC